MTSSTPQPPPEPDDAELAAALATGASAVLMDLRSGVDAGSRAGEAEGLRAAGDAAAQAYLADEIRRARPADAVLSEEAADDPRRLAADRVWIIDPLDGTREFAERLPDGAWRDDFAVHVALWRRGVGLADAAVALPARGVVHRADAAPRLDAATARAVLDGRRPLRLAASRTRPPAVVASLGERDDVTVVPMGSTGVKVIAVVEGTVDAYVHAGGQYEWDSAAPVAIALAAGLVATRLDGSPLLYNQANPWLPDLLVCRPTLTGRLRELLDIAGVGSAPGTRS